ncbi:C6 finger domain-containing protein [Pleurostoma richardsiae]|uniref:C6 finger domain-containing protein n=1 Tax=Pleurostoma richardsiae TaxID=41990 RepID=A0AA38S3N8_9PEZI|nr:C6 finger domain-containing protein [Pleurostoma richardsiae]
MAHGPEPPADEASSSSSSQKRKRDGDDAAGQSDRIPQPPPPQSGNGMPINYYTKLNSAKLQLVEVYEAIFSKILTLMKEYEGVLSRHESLAANLGAKLLGPRLVKALDNMFDGPIMVTPPDPYTPNPVAWFEIVSHLKANPNDYVLTTIPEYGKVCQFFLKGLQVSIAESDWRLIMSGTLDRFRFDPEEPLEEDEMAEIVTLDILEPRVQGLIMNADEVARKARQLNYHLSGRRAAIKARRSAAQKQTPGFQAVNQPSRAAGPTPAYDLHADLLQQFQAPAPQPVSTRVPGTVSLPATPAVQQGPSARPPSQPQQQILVASSRPSPVAFPEASHRETPGDDPSAAHRPFIAARIEKLPRGGSIVPPCDRCRRLRVQCIKHLTACQGCTKKHAKCSWKMVTEDEAAWLKGERGRLPSVGDMEIEGEGDGGSAGPFTPEIAGQAEPPRSSFSDFGRLAPDLRQEPRLTLPGGERAPSIPRERSMPKGLRPAPESIDTEVSESRDRNKAIPSGLAHREYRDFRDPVQDIIQRASFGLSHVASVASAAAEAREARAPGSRESSVS